MLCRVVLPVEHCKSYRPFIFLFHVANLHKNLRELQSFLINKVFSIFNCSNNSTCRKRIACVVDGVMADATTAGWLLVGLTRIVTQQFNIAKLLPPCSQSSKISWPPPYKFYKYIFCTTFRIKEGGDDDCDDDQVSLGFITKLFYPLALIYQVKEKRNAFI